MLQNFAGRKHIIKLCFKHRIGGFKMAEINNLERQHVEIIELIAKIKGDIHSKNYDELAININILAGIIKVHMSSEDKFLYPHLMKSSDAKIKDMAEQFISEMGDINDKFVDFKSKFNTKSKILSNLDEFLSEGSKVVSLLENRISKEDKSLYPLVKGM